MSALQAFLLGVLQGLTEFIPVSSSGHLVLVPWLLGWPASGLTFDAVLHLGTLIAVVAFFWSDLVTLLMAGLRTLGKRAIETPEERLAWLMLLSAIPAALLGFFLDDLFERLFETPLIVAGFLLVTGVLLFASERLGRRIKPLSQLGWRDALTVGVAQGLAIVPGLSRSGATISAGLVRGLERDAAARFSFLMSVPIIGGAAAYQMLKAVSAGVTTDQLANLAVGFLAALVSGYLAIRFVLGYVRTHSLRGFAIYCWGAGALFLALALLR